MSKQVISSIVFTLLAFVVSAGVSYGVMMYLYTPGNGGSPTPVATPPVGGKLNIDPAAPKTAECPLNGKMYTADEQKIWNTHRPLVTMIENSPDARPQSGLNSADVLYEAVAEGGVTRFAAVFFCEIAHADTILAPVRSARTHFIEVASEYNRPIYQHVGGANCDGYSASTCPLDKRVRALDQLTTYGWALQNDLDARSVGLPVFKRDFSRLGADKELATEHTMTTTSETVLKYMKDKRGWSAVSPKGEEWKKGFIPWTFKDDAKTADLGTVTKVSFGFWENYHDYDVTWNFDSATDSYKRETGGVAHTDLNDKSQLTAKVVVVQLVKEIDSVDALKHVFLDLESTGKAFIFQDGKVIPATWAKKDRESRTVYTDDKGKKINFNRGKIVVELVPKDNKITY